MEKRKILCKVLDYIDQNIAEKIDLQAIAKISGYSTIQITRLFDEYVGITPMKYINTMRIIKSAQLISDTNLRITDIALSCGFESLEVFERNFKRYFKTSASEFRKSSFLEPNPFYLSEKIYYERLRNKMEIDNGVHFDWSKTVEEYAKFRNIYPDDFFKNLHKMGLSNKKVLDIGTGTGILPMNMAKYGGKYIGMDKSSEMIEKAKELCSEIPNISFIQGDAQNLPFEDNTFDAVTALQCWVYFNKELLIPELLRVLKPNGDLYVMFMTWLSEEDEIVRKSFELVRKYNPNWSGFMKRFDETKYFNLVKKSFTVKEVFKKDYRIPFTKENWCGRMVASRGIGATLNNDKIECFKNELMNMLDNDNLSILHEAVIVKFRKELL
ncbi:MAG: methyltransferase domain-containing protein [Eubacterium sp.]|nr:methyltransferase domain-containing protein [Eubacterium sp.]